MKKIILIILFTFVFVGLGFAGEIILDTSSWTSKQKSQRFNAIASLIGKAGYDFKENWINEVNGKIVIYEDRLIPEGFKVSDLTAQLIFNETKLIIAENEAKSAQAESKHIAMKEALRIKLNLTSVQFEELIEIIKKEIELNK